MARGPFVGLFRRGVARQANATGAVMVGEFGARLERGAWQELVRFLLRRRTLSECRAKATKPCRLWDGGSVSGWMKSLAGLVGPAGCKIPRTRLVHTEKVAYISSLFNLSGLVWVR